MNNDLANTPVDDRDCIHSALEWIDEGHGVAIACVIETWGSAPRPVGSFLAINDQGAFVGSVSGGCIEGEVVTEALFLMRSGAYKTLEFAVSDEQATGAGLACGGKVSVVVIAVTEAIQNQLKSLLDLAQQKTEVALVFDTGTGDLSLATENEPRQEAMPLLQKGRSKLIETTAGGALFVRPFLPPLRLLIIGAVHIAQNLAVIARQTGYDVTLIDPRDSWATEERFPGFEIDRRMPGEALGALDPDQRTAVVALCHDPKLDDPALVVALKSNAFYIGALGSRKTNALRHDRLAEYGFDDAAMARINGPIGLHIGAATPAEIAVSILAEMTQSLRMEDKN